jgi:FKBP-type peptidyl-prolyl cis-trans isomerase|eukprot:Transcript_11126.p6 GENE.Transcript_11126~~Transcript_11126.p6  ORF type:complete len:124 (+),score=51.88 Transcript_11126:1047-1418(+)
MQVLGVRVLEKGNVCRRTADRGDLLEIRYVGRLADGTVFDGMQLAERRFDDSIQFVLGKQPAGQFPPSWDLGLVGMCVGERRELDVPPVLGFGPQGLPKRGVPPNARILYEIELLAIDANSTL